MARVQTPSSVGPRHGHTSSWPDGGLERLQYVDPATVAAIHEALGEADEALREYEKAYQDRSDPQGPTRQKTYACFSSCYAGGH
jgi:hypothetical protein